MCGAHPAGGGKYERLAAGRGRELAGPVDGVPLVHDRTRAEPGCERVRAQRRRLAKVQGRDVLFLPRKDDVAFINRQGIDLPRVEPERPAAVDRRVERSPHFGSRCAQVQPGGFQHEFAEQDRQMRQA